MRFARLLCLKILFSFAHGAGASSMEMIRGSSYYTTVNGPTWRQAAAAANDLGGVLASVTTESEFNFLHENNFKGWIGLSDLDNTGPVNADGSRAGWGKNGFHWSSGEEYKFEPWMQPVFNTDGNYVHFWDGHGGNTVMLATNETPPNAPWWEGKGIAEIPLSYFFIDDLNIEEGRSGNITVYRTGGILTTQTISLDVSGGTAEAGSDYTLHNNVLTFGRGQTSKIVSVTTDDDRLLEGNETFKLSLTTSEADDVPAQIAYGTSVVTILDNDSEASGESISAIVVDFSQVRQDLIDNSGGQVNSSSIIAGSDITINSDESFALVDESFGYNINVRGSLAIAINNDFENRREVSFRVSGTSSSDKLHGSIDNAIAELLEGGDGNDVLAGFRGADVLSGGNGDDEIHAGNGRDLIAGGSGNDEIYGGFGRNVFANSRDESEDKLYFKSDQFADNWVYGSAGNSPYGEKADIFEGLDPIDEVFVQGVATDQLSFGSVNHTFGDGQSVSGVGIFAHGVLEAVYTGGDLTAGQLQNITSGLII